jgi:hypothetical protein
LPRIGAGGAGGGGAGGAFPNNPGAVAGEVNTGGGGGGNNPTATGLGGSGIIILAHSNAYSLATVSAGLTYSVSTASRPGFIVYSFTAGIGTITWNPSN